MVDLAPTPGSSDALIQVLVLDDDAGVLRVWRRILRHERYHVSLFSSPGEALRMLRTEEVDVAVVDLCMPEMDGMRFLAEAKNLDRDVQVILMTGHADVRRAVEAIRHGAYDFLSKPFENPDSLELVVLRAAERRRLARRVKDLEGGQRGGAIRGFIGESPAIRRVTELVLAVAASDATVLVYGESGTGKELVAQAVHENSPRRGRPLMTVNCSAFADTLLEEELFGHVKGSFTGADSRKAGIFEAAHGGTVFLDEIADMSLACQSKVLRTLQEGEVRPVGATSTMKVNVRIVAATNVDLEERCRERQFRKDLFYRLNVVRIEVPPLRERRDDIPLLIAHFLRRCEETMGKRLDTIRPATLECLTRYSWPGNVRELKNAIERAVLLARPNRRLSSADFPAVASVERELLAPPDETALFGELASADPTAEQLIEVPFHEAKAQLIEQFERSYLAGVLGRHGSITAAAEAAGLDRSNFRRLLRRHGLGCEKVLPTSSRRS